MTKAYQVEEAARVASVNYVGIVYALFFGFLLWGEMFTWQIWVGMVLVLVGVVLNVSFKKLFRM